MHSHKKWSEKANEGYVCKGHISHVVLLPNPCSPMTPTDEVLQQGIWIKSADWEQGRLKSESNHLAGVWMPGSFMDQRWGRGEETKRPLVLQIFPRMVSLRQEDVLISSFLPSTGEQGPEPRHFSLTHISWVHWRV